MKLPLLMIALLATVLSGAQSADVSLGLQKLPVIDVATNAAQWKSLKAQVNVSFANSNMRYAQDRVPEIQQKTSESLTGWKGEKVHTQIAVWASKKTAISIAVSDLKSKAGVSIPKSKIEIGFLGYVITDEFGNGCGKRKPGDFASFLVADAINTNQQSGSVAANNVQPIWISVHIPPSVKPGFYEGVISVKADKVYNLKLGVNVLNKTLPPPSEWSFNLDFWQHPAAVARVHSVPLWSDEHFALMKKYYTMLAKAGQKNITASIVNEPWGHQTYDDYPSLVKWTKKKDGSWSFDYSLFDKYIAFVMSTGIDKRINCYSMVPWKVAFQYYDENFRKDTVFTGKIGSEEYNAFWTPMLKDFTKHLKQKGWFEKTAIAMDERPMDAMKSVINLLKTIDPAWKIALAGDYHPEIEKDIYDYCIASAHQFPKETLADRSKKNLISTWYTCCVEKYPNGFTFSPPAEHVWLGWYTAAKRMDGYLRWAYNSWTADPIKDSRFITWPAGDTYQVYPGPMTSIRFEKLIEGVQDFEKINLLRKEYRSKNQPDKLKALENGLQTFEIKQLEKQSAEQMVANVKSLLNN